MPSGRALPSIAHQRGAPRRGRQILALMREAADSGAPVALCDQDDIWHPDKLTRLHAALSDAEARFGADTPILVHSDARIVDADGRPLHASLWRHQGWNPAAPSLPELLVQNNVTGCLLMMNAPLCRLCAQHQPTGDLHMHDWFIALTAAAFGRIIRFRRRLRTTASTARTPWVQAHRGFSAAP